MERLGDGWWTHVERLGALPLDGPGGWELIDHFGRTKVDGRQLDWGPPLYPVTRRDVIALDSDAAQLRRPDSAPTQVSDLSADDNLGFVVVECA
jgi:hypothetical protein